MPSPGPTGAQPEPKMTEPVADRDKSGLTGLYEAARRQGVPFATGGSTHRRICGFRRP